MPPLLTQTLATMGLKAERREFDRMAALLSLLPPPKNLLSIAARTLDASALDSSAVRLRTSSSLSPKRQSARGL